MAALPTRVDASWSSVRQKEPPLFQMPHMWQPSLNMSNPYASSHCDRIQLGWRNWAHDHPNMYSRIAISTLPDWYTRRIDTIQKRDLRELHWSYEQPSKPTEKKAYGFDKHVQHPCIQRGFQATPHNVDGRVVTPHWGLHHPHHYQQASRVESLPLVHVNETNL